MMDDRISAAIVLFFSPGPGNADEDGEGLLAARYGEAEAPGLDGDIQELIQRSLDIGDKFRDLEALAAMDAVMGEMRREHPELSEEAIQALGLNWRYLNR